MQVQEQETPQGLTDVEGFQWEWTFLYATEGIFVSGKTLVRPAVMVLPVDEPVQITLTSRDVIHSFFIPALLFKRNVIWAAPARSRSRRRSWGRSSPNARSSAVSGIRG